ncbi:MAG TPA: GNAT family N-acetyltransferase [Candidatus Dormibacteraeota bacterium]|nr:GNAT family N-acetyltransferase [Candidatus Dormibacteraeota bacterium]
MDSRQATSRDLDAVTDTITLAFSNDPVWAVALARSDGRTDHQRGFWRFFVEGSHAVGGVRLLDGAAAVSVWLPPGAPEIPDEDAPRLDAYLDSALGPDGAAEMQALFARFDEHHPRERPHAYLSLLATNPAFAGRGLGQALLADDLARLDGEGLPAYLESTNPANDHRYERAGFRRVGEFSTVRNGAPVTTMWRESAGRADWST